MNLLNKNVFNIDLNNEKMLPTHISHLFAKRSMFLTFLLQKYYKHWSFCKCMLNVDVVIVRNRSFHRSTRRKQSAGHIELLFLHMLSYAWLKLSCTVFVGFFEVNK